MCPTFPADLPLPYLTLRLSTSTMLDTVLLDPNTNTPLFSIETVGNQTGLYLTAATSDTRQQTHLASVLWPTSSQKHQKKEKDALVTVDGVSMLSSAFLKKTVLGGSRRFHIPGQTHSLKWKHVGAHWECTLCSHACTTHRAVATFEPAHTTSNAHLNIYANSVGSSRPSYETGMITQYDDVDMVLLLYLVLSSLLLTTPPLAWLDLRTQVYPPCSSSPTSEKYSQHKPYNIHVLAPMITTSSPSPTSSKPPRIDLLGEDHHSPLRGSPSSQSSSCCSSLPASPLTPNTDLSPIHHDTFAAANASTSVAPGTPVLRRNSSRMPSPLVTCSTFSIPGCSNSNSPTTAAPSTPTTVPAGPNAITPYHLPPPPSHTPQQTPSTPHSLHRHHAPLHPHHHPHHTPPHHQHQHHHHSNNQQQQQQRTPTNNNALHLDTAHVASPVLPYTTQLYNIQFAPDPLLTQPEPEPARVVAEELPPAYNEIEWTVRVRQPRNGAQLRLHTVDV